MLCINISALFNQRSYLYQKENLRAAIPIFFVEPSKFPYTSV